MFQPSQDDTLKEICFLARKDLNKRNTPQIKSDLDGDIDETTEQEKDNGNKFYPPCGRSSYKVKRSYNGSCVIQGNKLFNGDQKKPSVEKSKADSESKDTQETGKISSGMLSSRTVYRHPPTLTQNKENKQIQGRCVLPHPSHLRGGDRRKERGFGLKRKSGADIELHLQQLKRKHLEFNWKVPEDLPVSTDVKSSDGESFVSNYASTNQRVPATPNSIADVLLQTHREEDLFFSTVWNKENTTNVLHETTSTCQVRSINSFYDQTESWSPDTLNNKNNRGTSHIVLPINKPLDQVNFASSGRSCMHQNMTDDQTADEDYFFHLFGRKREE